MKRVGVLLSGCGVYDGSEIHEAVLTLLAVDRAGARAVCMAPDALQHHVIDHMAGSPAAGETRGILAESARIARGEILALSDVTEDDLDALILPGGFGAAKNLCDYAFKGRECTVRPDVTGLIRAVHEAGKPVGAICIAPVILARVLGGEGVELTIGSDEKTASDLEAFGAKHVVCPAGDCHVDEGHRVVTTPAYMCAGSINEAAEGIERLVARVLGMA